MRTWNLSISWHYDTLGTNNYYGGSLVKYNRGYHYTAGGAEYCKSYARVCPEIHFGTVEDVALYHDAMTAKKAHDEKVQALEQFMSAPDPRYVMTFPFAFPSHKPDFGRRFGDELDRRYRTENIKPVLFRIPVQLQSVSSGHSPHSITVTRWDVLDRENAAIIGKWVVSTNILSDRSAKLHRFKPEKIELYFRDDDEAGASMDILRAEFRKVLFFGGLIHQEHEAELEIQTENMMADFMKAFNAAESAARGDFALWEIGYGYFQGSDGELITADEDYRTSAFRGSNVRDFLRDNHYYDQNMPAVEVQVTDHNDRRKTYWSICRFEDQFSVKFRRSNGVEEDILCANPQEAYNLVYDIVIKDINEGDAVQADRKATFAYELFWEIEDALELWKDHVARSRAEEAQHMANLKAQR